MSLEQQQRSKATETKMLEVKKPLPPPSINLIPGKIWRTYNNVAKTLNRAKVQSKVIVLTGGVNKINVTNDEEFRRLRNQVTEDGWEYYTIYYIL
jgi:hypothetical protein